MSRKILLSNIAAYSVAHALVDGACAAALFAIIASGRNDLQNLVQLYMSIQVFKLRSLSSNF